MLYSQYMTYNSGGRTGNGDPGRHNQRAELSNMLMEQLRRTRDNLVARLESQGAAGDISAWEAQLARERGTSITDRSLDQVAAEHGMTREELLETVRDGRVLVVGPGQSTFGAELVAANVGVDLTSVDTDQPSLRQQPGRQVSGSATNIPLESGTFGHVFLTYSLPVWAGSAREARQALDEGVRLLEPGGSLYVAPAAQARFRVPTDPATNQQLPGPSIESDPRFQAVSAQVDVASINWLEGAATQPELSVTLTGSLPYGDDFGGIIGATVTRNN